MKARITMLALCVALSTPVVSSAEEKADDAKQEEAATKQEKAVKRSGMPKFMPTNEGTPMTRLGGATRGNPKSVIRTEALVPEETGPKGMACEPMVTAPRNQVPSGSGRIARLLPGSNRSQGNSAMVSSTPSATRSVGGDSATFRVQVSS